MDSTRAGSTLPWELTDGRLLAQLIVAARQRRRTDAWALLPPRRRIERAQVHADLTVLARLAVAPATAGAVPLAASWPTRSSVTTDRGSCLCGAPGRLGSDVGRDRAKPPLTAPGWRLTSRPGSLNPPSACRGFADPFADPSQTSATAIPPPAATAVRPRIFTTHPRRWRSGEPQGAGRGRRWGVAATATRWSAAWSARPPPTARRPGCPDRPAGAAGR
jgi:hypothetical protein